MEGNGADFEVLWPRTLREQYFHTEMLKAEKSAESFKWYCFGVGFSVASLLFGILAGLKEVL